MQWSLSAASCCMGCRAASSRFAISGFWPIGKESTRLSCVPSFCPPRYPLSKTHAPRSPLLLAQHDCARTAQEHSCSSHGSPPLSYWLATEFRHWTPHDRPRARHFHLHCSPSQSGPTRGVPEIPIQPHQSPLSLPPLPHSLRESLPTRLNSGRPAPPELLKTRFKTQ